MTAHYRGLHRALSFFLIVCISLMNVHTVLADSNSLSDPTPVSEQTEPVVDPPVSTTETTVVETFVSEETPVIDEVTPTPEPTEPPVELTDEPVETEVVETPSPHETSATEESPFEPTDEPVETAALETPTTSETPIPVETTPAPEETPSATESVETPVLLETPPKEDLTAEPTESPVENTPEEDEETVSSEIATPTAEETPSVQGPVASVDEGLANALLAQVPDNADVVVLDENGVPVPLVSTEAIDAILDTDPMWCPAGVLPGGPGCSTNFATIAALLTSMRTTPGSYGQDGVIYFTVNPGASFTLTNTATSLGGSFATLSTFNLTLQGGWNGVNGAGATFTAQTNFGTNTLTVGTVANPWGGSVTLNNFTFTGVSSSNSVTVYTNTGNITLDNVDVAQQSGNNYTALLDSNGGNITVQNGSSFDGNNSGANQNRGFRAETNTGSITITGTSGAPITFTDAKGCLVIIVCIADTVVNNNGVTLLAPTVTLSYVTANNNDLNGIEISNANSVTLNNVISTNNGTNLLLFPDAQDLGSGVLVNGTGSTVVSVTGGTFSNNERYGIEVLNGTITFVVPPTCNANQLGCTNDTTPPVLTLPANITVEATGPSGAAVSFSATATDNLWGARPVTCAPASGSTFALGTTTVNCSASDPENNTATGSFTVTVQDTTGPVITAADITVEAESALGTVVNYTVSAQDLVDGSVPVTCAPPSGNLFPLGDTTVTCDAADSRGNTSTASFIVHVVDTTPPVIDPMPDITVEATSPAGAVATFTDPATFDIVDGPGVASCSPASGSTFPLGDSTVTCSATDNAGNTATTTFVVHVVDTTPPVIDPMPDITVEATSAAGANVAYTPPATSDAADGPGVASCAPAPGSLFPLGDTTVTCDATDNAGNVAVSTSFIVHVVDTTPPVIDPMADITVEATSPTGAVATYTSPSTSDLVDGPGVASCSPPSGNLFPLGDTTITCTATDSHNNTSTSTFVIHVVDTTPPVIAPHPDITVEATSPAGAVVTYTSPTTSDIVDGPGVATCSPASGNTFPLGDTTVTCDATDSHGNPATSTTFVVHVVDTTAPVIAPHPDITVPATSPAGAIVNYTPPATSDAYDGPGLATCSPASGSTFPLGDTTVTCEATDSNGNVATSTTFVIHVIDTGPVIAPHADVTVPATSPAGAAATYISPATSDAVDGPGVATCSPASGSFFAFGNTTITCNATDSAGNAATPTTFVVHVVDLSPPVIAPHSDITVEATSPAGAIVTYTSPATSDIIVDGPGVATCSPSSGSTFPLGDTTVTCNATDSAGNAATPTTFIVHVIDTTAPVIAPHADITVPATSPAGAVVNYTPPATSDAADGPGIASCSPAPGSTFPLGNTTVTCNATDSSGNTATPTTFVVHVIDTAPVIAAHPDITVEATSPAGAIVTYTSPATSDAVDGPGVAACSPVSGGSFPLGNTTITCNATDSVGNAATPTTFVVHVVDTSAPIIDPHPDVTVEATSPAGAVVTYTSPVTSDVVDGPGVATCSPSSGSTFPLGNTTVTCNATDSHGNAATPAIFVVHVVDTTGPVIAPHADITAETVSGAGVVINYTLPATSDAVDGPGVAACSPAPLSTFPFGNTTVTCNATDSHGNAATPTTFVVHVVDTIAPVIAFHPDETAEATSPAGAAVNYTPPATNDAADGPGVAACSPAPGSTFSFGNTTVTCNATDSNGNKAKPTSFVVHVVDTIPPVIASHPDMTAEATSPSGAVVNYSKPSTSDAGDGPGTASCSPASGSNFPLGDTTITCTAMDTHGNVATSTTFVIHVVDTTPPVIQQPRDKTVRINNTVGTIATYSSPSTSDAVDGTGTASCSPASGSFFPVGDTTITCTAADSHGNPAQPVTFTIHVIYRPVTDTDTETDPGNVTIPITGGSLIDLDCLTVIDVFGIKVTFHNLCDYQATLDESSEDTLPAPLPADYSYVTGLNIAVLFEGQLVEDLPNGTGVQLDYPIPADAHEQYAVLLWYDENNDGQGEWLEVTQLMQLDELDKVLSTDAEDELYRIAPTEAMKMYYQILTAGKTGTFILVRK